MIFFKISADWIRAFSGKGLSSRWLMKIWSYLLGTLMLVTKKKDIFVGGVGEGGALVGGALTLN